MLKIKDYIIYTLLVICTVTSAIGICKSHVIQGEQGIQGVQGDKGEQGIQGERGLQGIQGEQGLRGFTGEKGEKGDDGASAYSIARNQGFDGSPSEWLESLKGEQGERGLQGLKGDKGDKGEKGDKGDSGYTCNIVLNTTLLEDNWILLDTPQVTSYEYGYEQTIYAVRMHTINEEGTKRLQFYVQEKVSNNLYIHRIIDYTQFCIDFNTTVDDCIYFKNTDYPGVLGYDGYTGEHFCPVVKVGEDSTVSVDDLNHIQLYYRYGNSSYGYDYEIITDNSIFFTETSDFTKISK